MNSLQENRVVIAAGGSGGHIFPALHIADALKSKGICNLEFIGVGRPAENVIFEKYNYPRHVIATSGIKQGGIKTFVKFVIAAPQAFFATWKLFKLLQPKVVIATGGYSAFYPVLVAYLRRIPSIIHEAENKFGLANSVLALIATRVTLAFKTAKAPFWAKTVYTGHPVRKSLVQVARVQALAQAPQNILLMGGSQGSDAIDQVGLKLATFFTEHNLKIMHQCREENKAKLQQAYSNSSVEAQVQPFIHDMDAAYAWSDLVVSRAGAGTVSELAVVNRPAILVPYPYAQADHQSFNAQVLVDQQRAFLVREGTDFIANVKLALEKILDLDFYNTMLLHQQTKTISAADQIANLAIELGQLKGTQ